MIDDDQSQGCGAPMANNEEAYFVPEGGPQALENLGFSIPDGKWECFGNDKALSIRIIKDLYGASKQVFECPVGKHFAVLAYCSIRGYRLSSPSPISSEERDREFDLLQTVKGNGVSCVPKPLIKGVVFFKDDALTRFPAFAEEMIVGDRLGSLFTNGSLGNKAFDRVLDLPNNEACEIVLEVARALQPAHKAQIVHRDLSPNNIMYRTQGGSEHKVKIIDWGTSTEYEPDMTDPMSGTVFGTGCFAAPESRQQGDNSHDPKVDVYSLGVILLYLRAYHILYEQRVWPNKVYWNARNQGFDLMPYLDALNEPHDNDRAFAELVKKCTSIRQDDRPSLDELIEALGKLTTNAEGEYSIESVHPSSVADDPFAQDNAAPNNQELESGRAAASEDARDSSISSDNLSSGLSAIVPFGPISIGYREDGGVKPASEDEPRIIQAATVEISIHGNTQTAQQTDEGSNHISPEEELRLIKSRERRDFALVLALIAIAAAIFATLLPARPTTPQSQQSETSEQVSLHNYPYYYHSALAEGNYFFGPSIDLDLLNNGDLTACEALLRYRMERDPALGTAVMAWADANLGTHFVCWDGVDTQSVNDALERYLSDDDSYLSAIATFFSYIDENGSISFEKSFGDSVIFEMLMCDNPYSSDGTPMILVQESGVFSAPDMSFSYAYSSDELALCYLLVYSFDLDGETIKVAYMVDAGFCPVSVKE